MRVPIPKAPLLLLIVPATARNATVASSTGGIGTVIIILLFRFLVLIPCFFLLPRLVNWLAGGASCSICKHQSHTVRSRACKAEDVLEAAEIAGRALRARVSGRLERAGWFAMCFEWAMLFDVFVLGNDSIGPQSAWAGPVAPGVHSGFLASVQSTPIRSAELAVQASGAFGSSRCYL
jgi:hypothetical protein